MKNNDMMIIGLALAGAFILTRNRPALALPPTIAPGEHYGSMPGSTGVGWRQIGMGAVDGLLGALGGYFGASGNNGSSAYIQPPNGTYDTGAVQDTAPPRYGSGGWF